MTSWASETMPRLQLRSLMISDIKNIQFLDKYGPAQMFPCVWYAMSGMAGTLRR